MGDAAQTSCLSLPTELLINIFEYLNESDLLSLALTCKALYSVVFDDRLWRSLCVRKHKCQPFPSGKQQLEGSLNILQLNHIPYGVKCRLKEESLDIIKQAGNTFRSMKEHFQYIKQATIRKTFLHSSIFQASLEHTFGYLVHSSNELVGRELIASIEHCNCEWSINLMERVLDHSKIPILWKAILICKIYWTCTVGINFKQAENSNYCTETYGIQKLNFLLEKAINQHSWDETSEIIVDVLLLLGATPTRVTIKRALTSHAKDAQAFENFKNIFPKLTFALGYSDHLSEVDNLDDVMHLACALERFDIEYGPEGDVYFPVHIAALNQKIDVLIFLVEHCGIDINQPTTLGTTALSLIFNNTKPDESGLEQAKQNALICLNYGAQLTSNVLKSACQGGYWDFITEVIDKYPIDPCIYFYDDNQISTPLQMALEAKRIDLAINFVQKGGHIIHMNNFNWINEPNAEQFFLLSIANNTNWATIIDQQGNTIAHDIALRLDCSVPIYLLFSILTTVANSKNPIGNTPLQVLIDSMTERTPLCYLLIYILCNFLDSETIDNINVTIDKKVTEKNIIDIFQSLIREGTIMCTNLLSLSSCSDVTLLDKCVSLKRYDLVSLLLTAGGNETKQLSQLFVDLPNDLKAQENI